MAALSHSHPALGALSPALPRLYKFALVLTANEQIARGLVRGTFRQLNGRFEKKHLDRDDVLQVMRRMATLWSAKLAEDPGVQKLNPPEPRLFSAIPIRGSVGGNAHFSKFVATMPSQQRSALYLIYGEDVSYDEAADILSLNMMAMMKIIARGHLALSNWLDHRGYTDTPPAYELGSKRVAEKAA